jgi:hypothetical protein
VGLLDTSSFKPKPKLSYMTAAEQNMFKSLRKGQALSFFRIGLCPCGEEIPKNKDYCSKDCYDKSEDADDDSNGTVD